MKVISKGIGLPVVRTLATEGAEVLGGARTLDTLEGLEGVTGFRAAPRRARASA